MNSLAVVTRPSSRRADIVYRPAYTEQGEGLNDMFTVKYDIDRSMDGGDILVIQTLSI